MKLESINLDNIGFGKNFQDKLLALRAEFDEASVEYNLFVKRAKDMCTTKQLVTLDKALSKNWQIISFNEKSGYVKLDCGGNNQVMTITADGKFTRK